MYSLHFTTLVLYFAVSKIKTTLVQKSNRPTPLTQCCTQFKSPRVKILCVLYSIIMLHSHLNDGEIPETKRFILKGFELGTTFSL